MTNRKVTPSTGSAKGVDSNTKLKVDVRVRTRAKAKGAVGNELSEKALAQAGRVLAMAEKLQGPLAEQAAIAEEFKDLFEGDSSEQLIRLSNRLRSQAQQVTMNTKRFMESRDEGFKHLALHQLETLCHSEAAIDGLLFQKLRENIQLSDADSPERMAQMSFPAPAYLPRMVVVLRHEMEQRFGRRMSDAEAIVAAVQYCFTEIEKVVLHPLFASHTEALLRQPKIRPASTMPLA